MASKSQFLPEWEKKIAKSEFKVDFSEILLSALYYKTDVGIIPRGGNVDTFPVPKFLNNSNWEKKIVGCYWCGKEKVEYQGICCSVECLYTFHEWCIEKTEKDSEQKFCRLPGCDQFPQETHMCCCKEHKEDHNSNIKHCGTKRKLENELKKGPKWYDKQVNNDQKKQVNNDQKKQVNNDQKKQAKSKIQKDSSKPKQQNKPSNECKMDIASVLKQRLISDTDVGPIPRNFKMEEHLNSQFSSSPNWNREISGCYMCGKNVSDTAEYLCSKKCYFAFNEWCRRKVLSRVTFCKFPGCGEEATVYCSKAHEKETKNLFNKNLNSDQVDKGPTWYQCNSTFETPKLAVSVSKIKSSTQTKPIRFQKGELVFGEILTRFLYEKSDVGPIPRKLFERLPDSCIKTTPGNSNALIPGCYWCCEDNQSIHGVACSEKCFFLLNEWCHRKYQKSASNTNRRLCKLPLCDSSVTSERDCCKREHFDGYQSRFTSKFGNELKSTNFALGPKWYHPDDDHIDFYDVDEPFYEFTNFSPCTHLYIDNVSWPTTEHYFQSQKFVGTPFIDFIRAKQTPRDAFEFSRIPSVQKWIRIDWEKVKVSVMLKALEQKFTQNTDLGDLLIRTGDRKLFEHTHNDRFWGDGGDWMGQNMLGLLLMQVRFDLQRRIPYLPPTLNHFTHEVSSNKDNLSSQGSNLVGGKSDSAMGGQNTSTFTPGASLLD